MTPFNHMSMTAYWWLCALINSHFLSGSSSAYAWKHRRDTIGQKEYEGTHKHTKIASVKRGSREEKSDRRSSFCTSKDRTVFKTPKTRIAFIKARPEGVHPTRTLYVAGTMNWCQVSIGAKCRSEYRTRERSSYFEPSLNVCDMTSSVCQSWDHRGMALTLMFNTPILSTSGYD